MAFHCQVLSVPSPSLGSMIGMTVMSRTANAMCVESHIALSADKEAQS